MGCTTAVDKQLLTQNSINIPTRQLSIPADSHQPFSAIGYSKDELYHPVYDKSTKEELINQVWTGREALLESH
jgi:hypothetical protein